MSLALGRMKIFSALREILAALREIILGLTPGCNTHFYGSTQAERKGEVLDVAEC